MVRTHVTLEAGPRAALATNDRTTTVAPSARLPAPSSPTIVQSLAQVVQRDGDDGSVDAATVHRHARAGLCGPASPLPFLAEIQQAFGRHDVTGVRAHVGGPASLAARGMRARAYAVGERVAFARAPDLRTAAHEAAHVVQQRAGVQLPDGVGRPGDAHEQHAERVADLVADGRSAEAALGPPIAAGTAAPAVQRALSEQALIDAATPLRAPDTLGQAATLKITESLLAGTKNWKDAAGTRDLNAGIRVNIVAPGDQETRIEIFEWNPEGGYDRLRGTVPTAAIAFGTDKQSKLDDQAVIVPDKVDDITQAAVYQAGLSDCYFQAALAALAHTRPQDILGMIEDDGATVKVRLYEGHQYDPKERIITLERSLFVDKDGEPIYHGKKGAPLWPAFISKAWAVLKGSYTATQMGLSSDAMFALTGKYSVSKQLEQLDTGLFGGVKQPAEAFGTYSRIRDNLVENKPVALATGTFIKTGLKALLNATKDRGSMETRSLPAGDVRNQHVYAVLDIKPRDLTDDDFQTSVPSVEVTLRDPRNILGGTFTRTLADIHTAGKFTVFSYEE